MKIPYVDLPKQYKNERREILSIIDNVFKTGQYVFRGYRQICNQLQYDAETLV